MDSRLLPLLLLPLLAQAADPGSLRVVVENVRSDQGTLNVALFADEEGFPSASEQALRAEAIDLTKPGAVTVEFTALPHGRYAVSVYHDENGNGRLDTNWLGIPKEGVGFYGNPSLLTGPPGFAESSFELGEQQQSISLELNY